MRTHNFLMLARTLPALLLGATFAASAGEDVDETRELSPGGLIEIYNTRGEVAIEGWDKAEVRVRGELDDLAEGLEFIVDGDSAVIRVKLRQRNVNRGDGSDLRIRVPASSRVHFSGVSTELRIRAIAGGIDVDTVSGAVRARDIGSAQRVKTVSGNVTLRDSAGDLRVSSVSGDVDLNVDANTAVIDAVSGEVEARLGMVETLNLKLISGEAELRATLSTEADVFIESVSGDVDLRLADPLHAELDLRTGAGGDIDNDLNNTRPERNMLGGRSLHTRVGAGSARVRMQTVSGDLRVHPG